MTEDIEYEISNSIDELDRILEWIRNCDAKASVLFAGEGILFSIILTSDFLKSATKYLSTSIENDEYLVPSVAVLVIVSLLVSLFFILSVITPITTNIKKDSRIKLISNSTETLPSIIFFGEIKNQSFKKYKKMHRKKYINKKYLLDDYLFQIYVNSIIAQKKHNYLKFGIILFVFALLVTICLYAKLSWFKSNWEWLQKNWT